MMILRFFDLLVLCGELASVFTTSALLFVRLPLFPRVGGPSLELMVVFTSDDCDFCLADF